MESGPENHLSSQESFSFRVLLVDATRDRVDCRKRKDLVPCREGKSGLLETATGVTTGISTTSIGEGRGCG